MNKREARRQARQIAATLIHNALHQSGLIETLASEGFDRDKMYKAFEDIIHMLLNPGVSMDVRDYQRKIGKESIKVETVEKCWQDDKELNHKFWTTLHDICKERGISVFSAACVVDRGFSWNYMEHKGTFEEAIEILRRTADEMIADNTIPMEADRKKRIELTIKPDRSHRL